MPSLKYWSLSGEPLLVALSRRLLHACPAATLLNLYGSTEVAGDVTWTEVTAGLLDNLDTGNDDDNDNANANGNAHDGNIKDTVGGNGFAANDDAQQHASMSACSFVPVGRAIPGCDVRVVDPETLIPVPRGVRGEIIVLGNNLAEYYHGKAETTAESFVSVAPEVALPLMRPRMRARRERSLPLNPGAVMAGIGSFGTAAYGDTWQDSLGTYGNYGGRRHQASSTDGRERKQLSSDSVAAALPQWGKGVCDDGWGRGVHAAQAFRTGDFGSWGKDGLLRLSGRCDQQVKVRGHRVELL